MPILQPQTSRYDAIETERVGGHVVLTRMRGHITGSLMEQMYDQFRSGMLDGSPTCWIIEQLELTSFDTSAVTKGERWFRTFKDRGGERVILVSNMSASRMVAASLAFAVRTKISSCDTLREAYDCAGLGAVEVRPSMFTLSPPQR